MAFLDNVSKKLTQAGQGALQKTKEIADSSRLNSAIANEEKQLNNFYFQIGKLYAQLHSSDYEESFASYMTAVNEALARIDTYQAELQALRAVTKCPQCGTEVPNTSMFCNSCGTPIPKAAPAVPADCVVCTSCGSFVNKEMRFCTNCGVPMPKPVDIAPLEEPMQPMQPVQPEQPVHPFQPAQHYQPVQPPYQPAQPPVQPAQPPMQPGAQLFCPSCGTELDPDSVFCAECGTRI